MTAHPMVVSPADRPETLNVVGEQITVLASGAQTGSYEIFLQSGPQGSGPPPHHHPWDEAFYVIAGEVAFGVADLESVAGPGTFVQLPGGTTHWFRFVQDGGQMISVTSRQGASEFFTELDRTVSPEDPDLGKLVAIAESHGLSVPPPPS